MSKDKNIMKTLGLAAGATFAASLALSNVVNASPAGENPFAMSEMKSGYMQLAEAKCGEGKKEMKEEKTEGKCGEGKCGEGKMKAKDAEGKCGEGKKHETEKKGKCGSN